MPAPPLSPAHINELGFGFMGSRVLLSAVELGLFTELARRGGTAEELCERIGLHPRSARDFLDALVSLRMLKRGDNGFYENTPEADAFLDRDKPAYIGGLFEMAAGRLFGFWNNLTPALKTGAPQNEVANDPTLVEKIYANEPFLEFFLAGMTGASRPVVRALAEKFPWSQYKTVIDIGTAQGAAPVVLAECHPHLECGGFDLPPVRPIFERFVARNGLSDRVHFHPGDFRKDPLPNADVLVMGHILHDWDLAAKRHLIKAAYRSLPNGGALVIYDMMIDDARRTNTMGLLMSLNMLIETPGGFDYTGADCRAWLAESGFHDVQTVPLVDAYSMTFGVK